MLKFRKSFVCDVCGGKIIYPNYRIEWGYTQLPSRIGQAPFDFIQVCHEECSYGIQGTYHRPVTIGDMILDQGIEFTPQDIDKCLSDLSEECPLLADKIESIKDKIFE